MPQTPSGMDPFYGVVFRGHVYDNDYIDFFSLPEEIQAAVNSRDHEFRSAEDMRRYIKDLMRRA
ncbi:MAG TPA: hypothetical protein GXX54_05475 [Clostridiales bacterium]|nr:hypothetical protein [Clostridiales bacterium]